MRPFIAAVGMFVTLAAGMPLPAAGQTAEEEEFGITLRTKGTATSPPLLERVLIQSNVDLARVLFVNSYVDFNEIPTYRLVLEQGMALPTDGVEGRVFWDTLGKQFYIHNGTTWAPVNAGLGVASVGTEHLADGAVTTQKIANGTIAFEDIAQNGALDGQVIKWTGSAWTAAPDAVGADGSGGTVTSVGLQMPTQFTVGPAVTTFGSLTANWTEQPANLVLAGPTTGVPAAPTFRALAATDIPDLDASKITAGTLSSTVLPPEVMYSDTAQTISQPQTFSVAPTFAAAGVAPFSVASNTLVTNLNADFLDSHSSDYFLDTSLTAQTKAGALTVGGLTVASNRTTIDFNAVPSDDFHWIKAYPGAAPTGFSEEVLLGFRSADGGGLRLVEVGPETFFKLNAMTSDPPSPPPGLMYYNSTSGFRGFTSTGWVTFSGAGGLPSGLSGQYLRHNGTAWTASPILAGELPSHTHLPAQISASGATPGSVLAVTPTSSGTTVFTTSPTVASITTTGQNAITIGPYGATGNDGTGRILFFEKAENSTNFIALQGPEDMGGVNRTWILPAGSSAGGKVLGGTPIPPFMDDQQLAWVDRVVSVTAGAGLSGGTITTTGTLAVAFGGNGNATTVARSNHNHDASYIQNQTGAVQSANFLVGGDGTIGGFLRMAGSSQPVLPPFPIADPNIPNGAIYFNYTEGKFKVTENGGSTWVNLVSAGGGSGVTSLNYGAGVLTGDVTLPTSGATSYIQNQAATPQGANFFITGSGALGGSLRMYTSTNPLPAVPNTGVIYYNNSDNKFKVSEDGGSSWVNLVSAGGGGSPWSVSATDPNAIHPTSVLNTVLVGTDTPYYDPLNFRFQVHNGNLLVRKLASTDDVTGIVIDGMTGYASGMLVTGGQYQSVVLNDWPSGTSNGGFAMNFNPSTGLAELLFKSKDSGGTPIYSDFRLVRGTTSGISNTLLEASGASGTLALQPEAGGMVNIGVPASLSQQARLTVRGYGGNRIMQLQGNDALTRFEVDYDGRTTISSPTPTPTNLLVRVQSPATVNYTVVGGFPGSDSNDRFAVTADGRAWARGSIWSAGQIWSGAETLTGTGTNAAIGTGGSIWAGSSIAVTNELATGDDYLLRLQANADVNSTAAPYPTFAMPNDRFAVTADGRVWAAGSFNSATTKNFVIDHPLDPEGKVLVHASLEGPEAGVYYRGEARLADGAAEIALPDYFEALTRDDGRTVQLTCRDGFSPLFASEVRDGRFTVRTTDAGDTSQTFYWEVKAVRADVDPLQVEVPKATAD